MMRLALLAIAVAGATAANAEEPRFYGTLGAAHVNNEIFDHLKTRSGDHVNNSWITELSAGYLWLPHVATEFSAVLPSPMQGNKQPEISQLQLKGLFFFSHDALKPYATVGFGRESFEVSQDTSLNDVEHFVSWGAGLQYDVNDRFFARAEYQINEMMHESNEHGIAMFELGLRFGGTSAAPRPVVAAPAPVVVAAPEPAPVPVIKPVVEPVAEPVAVAVVPVVGDADDDGVLDDVDVCPDTFVGATVDSQGCSVFDGKLEGVNFESGSARLTLTAMQILDDAVAEISRFPDLQIEIAAFTDSQGAASFNQRLSQQRADSVRSYLIAAGIGADQLTAVGYGEESPIASNDTANGRALNRRVELRVID